VENHHEGIIIPHDNLTEAALQGLIEEFVTREGTDTGYTDGSLEENVEMVKRQLKRGDVLIVYDGIPKRQISYQRKTPEKKTVHLRFEKHHIILIDQVVMPFSLGSNQRLDQMPVSMSHPANVHIAVSSGVIYG